MTQQEDSSRKHGADVVIAGGGLAGLTAGVGLTKCGLSVTVLESDAILGGRARSWIDKATGDAVTIGPHIFLSKYPNMRGLLRMLGTGGRIVWQEGRFIDIVEGRDIFEIKMADLPPPLHYAPSLMANSDYFPSSDLASNRNLSFFCMGLDEEDIMALDRVDALTMLRRFGVSERFIRRFWEFTCIAIMNVPIDKCSAGALFRFFKMMISARRYDVGFADGGLGDLFCPQARKVMEDAGGKVLTGAPVETILEENGRASGVRLKDGAVIRAKHVIATLPPTDLGSIIPETWRKTRAPFNTLEAFKPSPYVSTYLWFDRNLTDRQFWARGFRPQDLNCDFYDYDNIFTNRPQPGTAFITTNCIYCHRAEGMDDGELIRTAIDELADFLPEAKQARLVHSLVNRIPMAIHCPHPGIENLRPPVRTDVPGLYVAGDWIATGVPSSMESACAAAWMAVEAVMEQEGRPLHLAVKPSAPQGISALVHHAAARLKKWGLYRGAAGRM